MEWEDIVLSALRNREDLEKALKEAAERAPMEISFVLLNLQDNIDTISEKLETCPKVILLLYFHFLAIRGEFSDKFIPNQQDDALEISRNAATEAFHISKNLGEKGLEAMYAFMAGNFAYKLHRLSEAEKMYSKALETYRILAKNNSVYLSDVALALNGLGNTYSSTNRVPEAEKAYTEALEKYRALEKKNRTYAPKVAQTLNYLGNLYNNTREFSKAEKAYAESLEKYEVLAKEDPKTYASDVAGIFNNLGVLFLNSNSFSEAEKAYTEALGRYKALARENPEIYTFHITKTLENLGLLYWNTRRFSEAEKVSLEALESYKTLVEENPDIYSLDVAKILNNLGLLYQNTKRFSEAEKAYTEALERYQSLAQKDPKTYAHSVALTLNNLGILYSDTGKFSEAEKTLNSVLEIRRTLAKKYPGVYLPDVALALNSLGILFLNVKKFSEAEEVFTEALEKYSILAKEDPGTYTSNVAMILHNLGTLYRDKKKFSEAEKAFTESLEKCKALALVNPGAYLPAIATALGNHGIIYWETKRFSDAEKALTEALEKYRVLAEQNPKTYTHDVATTLNSLGVLYSDIGKFSEAKKIYREALEIGRTLAKKDPEVYMPEVALILNSLGLLFLNTGEFAQAEKAFTEALGIRKALDLLNPGAYTVYVATTLNDLGAVFFRMKRFSEAEKILNESLNEYESLDKKDPGAYTPYVAGTLNSLGVLYGETGRLHEAERAFNEALKRCIQNRLWFDAAQSASNLYIIKKSKKILENSRKLLELAILFSREEKYKYAQKKMTETIYLYLIKEEIDPFGVLETLRDPHFLSIQWDQALPQHDRERAQINSKFQKMLVKRVLKKQIPYREPITEFPETLLFIYIQILEGNAFFFAVGDGKTEKAKCEKQFSTKGLQVLFSLDMQQLTSREDRNITSITERLDMLSRQWFEILPREIKTLIQEKDHIVFSPDYGCSFLPLEILQIDDQPLCIEKTVVRATSLNQFSTLLTRKPHFGSSLLVGNPWPECKRKELIYYLPPDPSRHFRLAFLGSAEEEGRALERLLPNPTFLRGHQATGERFLLEISNHSLIHFSGHGSLGNILFLSGPFRGFPPPFEPEELSNFRKAQRIGEPINMMQDWHPITDVDLSDRPLTDGAIVFLNACEAGKHEYEGGGYYQGLPTVFLKNGAHSVISSPIPIFDEPSKEFAVRFYEILFTSHSVTKALREARIWIKRRYEAQIFWAPYIHYGSPL